MVVAPNGEVGAACVVAAVGGCHKLEELSVLGPLALSNVER